jgi:ABC-type sugar transport system substrate-binding protein
MANLVRLILVVCAVFLMGNTYAKSLDITFIVPDSNGPAFWKMVTSISQVAAETLDVNLEVIYSANNRFEHKLQLEKIVKRKRKPDYIVFRPFQGTVKESFNLLEKNQISFVTLERAIFTLESESIGDPRQKYKHWIGQVIYDNVVGGNLLKEALTREYFVKNPGETLFITGIGGNHDTLSLDRQAALERIMRTDGKQQIIVNQIIPMLWDLTLVNQRFPQIMKRYPNTNAFWCAGDAMALEVLNQLKRRGVDNILIGGFDWLPEALQQIEAGNFTASVGGHFLMAASAIVKIVDYHQGVDSFNLPPLMNEYEIITKDNVSEYLEFMKNKAWRKIDFSVFLHSKSPTPPEFSVKNMIKQLEH